MVVQIPLSPRHSEARAWPKLLALFVLISVIPLGIAWAQPAPTVTTLSPTRNVPNAAVNSDVLVTFSQLIQNNVASQQSVRVFSQQRGGRMFGSTRGSTIIGGNTVRFNPTNDFKPGETLLVTTTGAVNTSGTAMAAGRVHQFTAAVSGTGRGLFTGTQNVATGTAPKGIAVGDADNDGDLDMFVANEVSNTVSVRLNNGTGTFTGTQNVSVGSGPTNVVVGDVDGDGDLDFLTANFASGGGNTVSVRLNNGTGTFSGTQNVSVGFGVANVALGDVDGDGDLDLAAANSGTNTASVRLNDGAGNFSGTQNATVGNNPFGVALGDVDNDGDLDLLTATFENTVNVRLNNGSGTFSGTQNVSVNGLSWRVALGDIDADGDLDLVSISVDLNTASVRVNNGSGVFSGTQNLSLTGFQPTGIALSDVDADGDLDLLVGMSGGGTTVNLRLNNGAGIFSGTTTVSVGNDPWDLAVGDVDGDGDLDLLTANSSSANASVRFNSPPPPPTITSFTPTRNLRNAAVNSNVAVTFSETMQNSTTTQQAVRVFSQQRGGRMFGSTRGTASVSGSTVTFDPTNDFRPGETLLVTTTTGATSAAGAALAASQVHQFTAAVGGTGRGNFTGTQSISAGNNPNGVAVGDADNDGDLDMFVANGNDNTVSVRLNNGTGTFTGTQNVSVGAGSANVALGDVDGDGDLDFLTANFGGGGGNTVSVRLNNGTGTFSGTQSVSVGMGVANVALGDVDGDGDLDLATANSSSPTASVRLNDGAGNFSGTQDVTVGNSPFGVALGDVDNDGDLDLLTANASSTVSVRLNNGSGTFSGTQNVSVVGMAWRVALGDIDADGDLDLLATSFDGNTVCVRVNNGSGVFSGTQNVSQGTLNQPTGMALSDVDADGDLDLFVGNSAGSTVSLRLNNGTGTFSGTTEVPVGNNPWDMAVGDVDGDGDLDLLTANSSSASANVRFNSPPPPTITSFTPTSGGVGTVVTLTGTNLTGATAVSFNGTAATTFTVNSATQITVTVPTGTTTGTISVTTPNGSATSSSSFTFVNNQAPTALALSATSIAENTGANAAVGTFSTTDPNAGNTFTYTLVTGTGSTDNALLNISGNSLRITASPDFETRTSYAIRVRTTDQGGLFFEQTFTISVTNVNETPTALALSASSIAENTGANAAVGTFSTTDVDAANTFTYTLVTGTGSTDNALLNISGNSLRITASPDFETRSSYAIRVRTTDQGGLFFEQTFTISVTNVNETPTALALSASSIAENTGANAAVGTLSTTDVDAGNTFTYTLVAGTGSTDNALLNISGNSLRITASPDFETRSSYAIRVRTTDQGGLFFEQTFTISVTDVNETPTALALSASSIAENTGANATVGTLSSTDADAANTFTYTLVSGTGSTDNALVNISGNSLRITASPDFETKSSYAIRVRTADQGGLFFEQTFTISITNENEDPTALNLSATSLNENVAAGTTVGTLSTTDPDAGNTFTYALVGGLGSADNGDFSLSGNTLSLDGSPNFEVKASYAIRVRTTDQGGSSFDQTFTITINDLNEAPTALAVSPNDVDENVTAGTAVGTLQGEDTDAGSTLTYTLVSGAGSTDNAAFSISGDQLLITASPDYETQASYDVRVRVTDQGGLSFEQALTISVNNRNDAPTSLTINSTDVNENALTGTNVGIFSSTDPDGSTLFDYELVSGAGSTDNAAFTIVGTALKLAVVPDYETQSSYAIRVRTTDGGGLFREETFSITITNVNEEPTALALSNATLAENVAAGATVGTLSTTDPDAGNTFTYTLVNGAGSTDNAAFSLVGNALKLDLAPDFESQNSYAVRVRTTDQDGLFFEQTFTVTITDVAEIAVINSFAPTSGAPSTVVTITGLNFHNTTGVSFNGTPAPGFSVGGNGTQITVSVPAGATTGTIRVISALGTVSTTTNFLITGVLTVVPGATQTVPAGNYGAISVGLGSTVTLSGPVTVTVSMVVAAGATFDDNCFPVTGKGTFTVSPGATMRICNPDGIALTGASGAIQNTGARSFSPVATYIYDGTVSQITGSGLPNGVNEVGIENPAGVSLSQDLSITKRLVLAGTGNLNLNGNQLTLLSKPNGTALVANLGTGQVVGNTATVQTWLNTSPFSGSTNRHLSVPLTGATVADLATVSGAFTPIINVNYPQSGTPFPTVFGYDETRSPSSGTFSDGYYSPALTDALVPTRSFLVTSAGGETFSTTGTLVNGDQTAAGLTRTGNFTSNAEKSGWHLLGNPFPAPLDWDLVTVPAGLSNSISVWRPTGATTGVYLTRAAGVGTLTDGILPIGQGFFARVTGTGPVDLTLPQSARLTTWAATPAHYRSAPATERPLLSLTLRGADALASDETFVHFASEATMGADDAFDGIKPGSNQGVPTLATRIGSDAAAVNGLPESALAAGVQLPLLVTLPAAGTYEFGLGQLRNLSGVPVYLVDNLTASRIDLTTLTAPYRFTVAQPGEQAGRFWLDINPQRGAGIQALPLQLWPNPATTGAVVRVTGSSAPTVQLLDATGRVVRTAVAVAGVADLTTTDLPTGVYVVRSGNATRRLVVE